MYIYKVIADIERESVRGFDGKTVIQRETTENYLAAYSGEQAIDFVRKGLERNGWKVTEIGWRDIFLHDIRDSCDHTTDSD